MRFSCVRLVAPSLVLALFLLIVGCGGDPSPYTTTSGTTGSSGGFGGDTTGTADVALGLASVDLKIASLGAAPFDTMSGKGADLGYVADGGTFDDDTGAGSFNRGVRVGSPKGPNQSLQITFDHSMFVGVGVTASLDGKTGTATYVATKDGTSSAYHAVSGTATVTDLGEGASLTLALENVILRASDATSPDLTLSGTVTSSPLLGGGGYTNDNNLPDMGVLSGPLGSASLALPIVATAGTAPYDTLTGTAADRGYVAMTDGPLTTGSTNTFQATGFVVVPGTGSRQYQYLHLQFPHAGPIAVGTRASLNRSYNSAIYYAEGEHTGRFYDVTGGSVEVVAVGPSSTYTLRLNGVTFTPEGGGTTPTLVFSGTMSNAPEDYGAPGTSGYAVGYASTAAARTWARPRSR